MARTKPPRKSEPSPELEVSELGEPEIGSDGEEIFHVGRLWLNLCCDFLKFTSVQRQLLEQESWRMMMESLSGYVAGLFTWLVPDLTCVLAILHKGVRRASRVYYRAHHALSGLSTPTARLGELLDLPTRSVHLS